MKHVPLLALCLTFAACAGGGPLGAPSPTDGVLRGTWHGPVTFTKPVPMTTQMTLTFTPMANTGGHGFEAQASWMGITTRAMTATAIGSQFSVDGAYPSPNGCDGFAGGLGTVDGRTIDSSFSGSSSCDSVFEGHMVLTR